MSFKKNKYVIIKEAISKDLAGFFIYNFLFFNEKRSCKDLFRH